MKSSPIRIMMLVWFLCPAAVALADQVQMTNGDRFTGRVRGLEGRKLVLHTDYAGNISIDWAKIESVSTEQVLQVSLEDGQSIAGKIELSGQEVSVVTVNETLNFVRKDIVDLGPVPQPEDYGLLENWHGGLDLGVSLSRGNTDLSSFSFSASPTRETLKDRISIYYTSLRNEEDGRKNGNLYKLSGRYDRFVTENAFFYFNGIFDKDELADLEYRFREGGGLGYRFRPGDRNEVSLAAGVSILQERFLGEEPSHEGLASAGLEFKSRAVAPVVLTSKGEYSHFFENNRYLVEILAGVRLPLFGGLNFGFDIVDNYDSDPAESNERNDLRILSTLGWDF